MTPVTTRKPATHSVLPGENTSCHHTHTHTHTDVCLSGCGVESKKKNEKNHPHTCEKLLDPFASSHANNLMAQASEQRQRQV